MENENIKIVSDQLIISDNEIKMHISYDDKLTLKELTEILDLTNKAINDINRENGVGNNATIGKKYATEVTKVEQGSIVLSMVMYFVVPVSTSILAAFLYDRFKTIGSKKNKPSEEDCKVNIIVDGNNYNIDIHISKR